MSETASGFLELCGTQREFGAFVVSVCFDRTSRQAAFALGNGELVRVSMLDRENWVSAPIHDGAILALAADTGNGFITGGDDGEFLRISADGSKSVIKSFGGKWVEQVACFADGKSGLLACAAGKFLYVFDRDGKTLKTLPHPSTVTGIAFDAKGKRIAASHYNGASLWFIGSSNPKPRLLEWKGSHTGVAIHPAGEALVTSMQENALHGWRLSDDQHMRMTGYPLKTESMGFTRGGKYLASSGADAIVLWPFFGAGPMGKPPLEIAQAPDGVFCTRIACHPQRQEVVAAGYSNGMVVLADIVSQQLLPVTMGGHGAVSALAWSPDGTRVVFGTQTGFSAVVDCG